VLCIKPSSLIPVPLTVFIGSRPYKLPLAQACTLLVVSQPVPVSPIKPLGASAKTGEHKTIAKVTQTSQTQQLRVLFITFFLFIMIPPLKNRFSFKKTYFSI
jgi:hypothetical protein